MDNAAVSAVDVSFGKADVEAVGSAKPWTHRDEFDAEVDTEHMADTASIFAQAANEARDAGDLGERATRIGQQAGVRNGEAFVEDERIDATARGLQGNGDGIDDVVRMLVRAMNLAMETVEEVDAQIEGGNGGVGMRQVLERNVAAAVGTWERAQQFFASQKPPGLLPRLPAFGSGAPRFNFNNVEYDGVLSGDAWTAPLGLPGDIRDSYLHMTADEATWADEEITGAIRQYRQRLAEYGAELEESGYDTSQGPLAIWRSDEMAAFNGEEVKKLLTQGNPDPELLARYTSGLDSVAEDTNDKGTGARPPTREQQAYLNAFFGKVGTEDLLTAGRFRDDGFKPFQESLANGVIAASTGDQPLAAVREFFEKEPISDQGKDGHSVRLQAERFDDFGALMSHGTVTPSETFSTALINASLNATVDQQSTMPTFEKTPLEGAHKLLSLAATNDAAAAAFLSDPNQINRLLHWDLSSAWADNGRAVGDLLRAGTLPDGATFTAEDKDKLRAGFTLMQFVSDNADAYIHDQREFPPRAETAFAQIAGHSEYLDILMNPTDAAAGTRFDTDPNSPQAFHVSGEDRFSLLRVLAASDAEAATEFKTSLLEHARETAYEAFANSSSPQIDLERLAELNADFVNAEMDHAYRGDANDDERAKSQHIGWKAALAAMGGVAPGGWAAAGAFGSSVVGDSTEPDETADVRNDVRVWNEILHGGRMERHLIYDAAREAAREAGYEGIQQTQGGAEKARLIPSFMNPESWTQLSAEQREALGIGDIQSPGQRSQAIRSGLSDLEFYEEARRSRLEQPREYYTGDPEIREMLLQEEKERQKQEDEAAGAQRD